ncbi:MAG: glycosyltransferase family 9 protein [Phycisphaerales bacterium]
MPSWVGDAVMATPALRLLRSAFPGAFIGGLVRPGIDAVLAGLPFVDEFHVETTRGVMGPKRSAARLRGRRYELAVLLTNSFSTALTTRLAGIPRRIGYDRDGRGMLLTDRLTALRRRDVPPFDRSTTDPGAWAPVPACRYYFDAARRVLALAGLPDPGAGDEAMGRMELAVTDAEAAAALALLDRAGVNQDEAFAVLNPGGNNPAKRWPADRFAQVAEYLHRAHGLRCLVNGSPAENEVTRAVVSACDPACGAVALSELGGTLGSLKGVLGGLGGRRARLLVTNDTGPRHIAAAFGVPVVSLFGPTDPRWTTIPAREVVLTADPTLPEEEVADDHPERCRIERIETAAVLSALDSLLRS